MRPTSVARWVTSRPPPVADEGSVRKRSGQKLPALQADSNFWAPQEVKQTTFAIKVQVQPPQPTLRTEKDIGSKNPETTAVSGFCYAIFKSKIKKISFPQNDLSGGLELKLYSKSHIFLLKKTDICYTVFRKQVTYFENHSSTTAIFYG